MKHSSNRLDLTEAAWTTIVDRFVQSKQSLEISYCDSNDLPSRASDATFPSEDTHTIDIRSGDKDTPVDSTDGCVASAMRSFLISQLWVQSMLRVFRIDRHRISRG